MQDVPLFQGQRRPVRNYNVLKQNASASVDQMRALLRYATRFEKNYERSGLRPTPRWYRVKDYAHPSKPTAAAPAPGKGAAGPKAGGGIAGAIKSAFSALSNTLFAPSFSGPSIPQTSYGGEPLRKLHL